MPPEEENEDLIEEGISDEEFEGLRGKIVYHKDWISQYLMIGSIAAFALLTVFIVWVFFVETRSEEEILQERLHDTVQVEEMLGRAAFAIRNPHVSKEELKEAVKQGIYQVNPPEIADKMVGSKVDEVI